MNTEGTTEEQLAEIREKKSRWLAIIKQWDDLTPLAPVPAFTRQYSEKMLKKLEKEEASL